MAGTVEGYWNDLQRGAGVRPSRGRGLTALTAILVVVAMALLGARLAGLQPLTVLTGSMSPAYEHGDLVLVDRVPATAATRGDVITFADPAGRDRTLTHRVVSVRREGAELAFVTRGDANPAPERWRIPAGGRVGAVRAAVPLAGYAMHPLSAGWTRGLLLGLLTLTGAGAALWLIWRPGGAR